MDEKKLNLAISLATIMITITITYKSKTSKLILLDLLLQETKMYWKWFKYISILRIEYFFENRLKNILAL